LWQVSIREAQTARGKTAECFTSNWHPNKAKQGTGRTATIGSSWKGSW